MSDFSDKEDRQLVQAALKEDASGNGRVSWRSIAARMKTKKSPEQLRWRIGNLKKRFGVCLGDFPPWFFVKTPKRRDQQRERDLLSVDFNKTKELVALFAEDHCDEASEDELLCFEMDPCAVSGSAEPLAAAVPVPAIPASTATQGAPSVGASSAGPFHAPVVALGALAALDEAENAAAAAQSRKKLRRRTKHSGGVADTFDSAAVCDMESASPSDILSATESHAATSQVFSSVGKRDVRQESGKTESNVGELTPSGATEVISACQITSEDVFLDVGSGVGNVITQVALESNALAAIGIEIRGRLALQGMSLINMNKEKYPRLKTVHIYPQDVCALNFEADNLLRQTTILFCHNTLFKPEVACIVESLCCSLPCLRTVVLQQPFCHRHRQTCVREFCTLFRERTSPLKVSVTFTTLQSSLLVFDRSR